MTNTPITACTLTNNWSKIETLGLYVSPEIMAGSITSTVLCCDEFTMSVSQPLAYSRVAVWS